MPVAELAAIGLRLGADVPVLIHGQFLREDQVDSYQRLGVFPSLFPMHTFYWGDWHRDHTVGPKLADNISPTGWVRARGMRFGSHHDAPVAFPDSMRVLDATVTRRSRSGDIIGPEQPVDVIPALKATVAEFSGDDAWRIVRPPLVNLPGDKSAALAATLRGQGFEIPGL